ncbi:hypothetical protein K438DRAFT_1763420 [Mycena galopus ATCC 62051]|nr:hypothetical protein K438DRAFT_1763420 [Mycena galopus ATCC 62051]
MGTQPLTKIEWFFQVFDNCYASVLFLLRVHRGRVLNSQSGAMGSSEKKNSHTYRLRSLFFIALGNFVFPCLLSLIQLIFLFRDPKFLDGTYVFLTNCYVEIIGVLLATIWVAGGQWSEAHGSSSSKPTELSTIRYKQKPKIRIGHSVVTDTATDHSETGDQGMEMDAFKAVPGNTAARRSPALSPDMHSTGWRIGNMAGWIHLMKLVEPSKSNLCTEYSDFNFLLTSPNPVDRGLPKDPGRESAELNIEPNPNPDIEPARQETALLRTKGGAGSGQDCRRPSGNRATRGSNVQPSIARLSFSTVRMCTLPFHWKLCLFTVTIHGDALPICDRSVVVLLLEMSRRSPDDSLSGQNSYWMRRLNVNVAERRALSE